jgi:hypothetical protein
MAGGTGFNFRSRSRSSRLRRGRRGRRRRAFRERAGVSQRRPDVRRRKAIASLRSRRKQSGGVVSRFSGTPSFQKKFTKTLMRDGGGGKDEFGDFKTPVEEQSMDLSNLQGTGAMLAPQFGMDVTAGKVEANRLANRSFMDKVVDKLRTVGVPEDGREQTAIEKAIQFVTPQSKSDIAIEMVTMGFPVGKLGKFGDDAIKAAAKWDLEKILKTGNSAQQARQIAKVEAEMVEAAAKRFGTKKGLDQLIKKEGAAIATRNADELKRLQSNVDELTEAIAKTKADDAAAAAIGKLDDIDPNRLPFLESMLLAAKKTIPSAFNRLTGKTVKVFTKTANWIGHGDEWQTKLIMDKSGKTMGKKTLNTLRKFLFNKKMGFIGVGAYVTLLGMELVGFQQWKETFNDFAFSENQIKGVKDNPELKKELMQQWRVGKMELEIFAAKNPDFNKWSWMPSPKALAEMYVEKGKSGLTRIDIIDKIFADEIEKMDTGISDEALNQRNEEDYEQWTMESSIEKIRLEAIEFDRQQAVIRSRQGGQNRAEIEQAELIHRLAMQRLEIQQQMDKEMREFWTEYLKKKEEMLERSAGSNLNFGGLF